MKRLAFFFIALAAACGGNSTSYSGDGGPLGAGGTAGTLGTGGTVGTGGTAGSSGAAGSLGTGGTGGSIGAGGSGQGGAPLGCNAAPCGGDIVGRWTITAYCGPSTQTSQQTLSGCAEPLTRRVSGLTTAGTVEYRADGTYSYDITSSGTSEVTYPAACLNMSGITFTCEQLTQALQAAAPDAGVSSASCVAAAAGGCTCTAVVTGASNGGTGTYSTSGSLLTQGTGTSQSEVDYCVQGNQLTETPRTAGSYGLVFEKAP